MDKPKVVITYQYLRYTFQWFWLGFYQLAERGLIDFSYEGSFLEKLSYKINWPWLSRRLYHQGNKSKRPSKNLYGYIDYPSGERKYFCIDSLDAPYMFDKTSLDSVDVYFKMQCPKNLEIEGFFLNNEVMIPWLDHECENVPVNELGHRKRKVLTDFSNYIHKIKPLMIGVRRLSYGQSYKLLQSAYESNIKWRSNKIREKMMCYFGNAKGPINDIEVSNPDYMYEQDIVGYFGTRLSHPNEKRAVVADYLDSLGSGFDARIISRENSDSGLGRKQDLVVKIKDFAKHVSKFQYNFNVSGYQLSIPNRFMDSFMVGTGVVTDKLSVRWYKEFAPVEVIETVTMGYERNEDVDWEKFKYDVNNLGDINSERINELFQEKWAPDVVAQYIIDTVENS